MSDFFNYIITLKRILFLRNYQKYIMKYLVTAWDNKYICTFSRRFWVMSNNLS